MAALLAAIVASAAGWTVVATADARPASRVVAVDAPSVAPALPPEAEADLVGRQVTFIDGVARELVGAFLVGIAVEYVQWVQAEEAAAAEAARRAAPRSSGGGSTYGSVSGDCYASSLPDYIVSRESGGDPNARNPSGAWGCAQFMPGTWNGTCSDLGAHGSASVAAQNECADRLWDGGAGSSHWAATR